MREKTNINVTIVDFEPMLAKFKDGYIRQNPDFKEKEFSFYMTETWGFVETKKGKFMICDEGVMDENPVSETHPFYSTLYVKEIRPEEKFSIFPIGTVVVKKIEEIEELPVISKKPLETFIRQFGRRLETNFHLCKNFLEPIVRP
jgi:hypothetical protein